MHVCRVGDPEETKLILKAVEEDLLENGTVIESDLKLAAPVPSEHISPVEQVQNDREEIEQYYHDISGTWLPPELVRAGRGGQMVWFRKAVRQRSETSSDHESTPVR